MDKGAWWATAYGVTKSWILHRRREEIVFRHLRHADMVVARHRRPRVHAIPPFALVDVRRRLVDAVRHRLGRLLAPAKSRPAGKADGEVLRGRGGRTGRLHFVAFFFGLKNSYSISYSTDLKEKGAQ